MRGATMCRWVILFGAGSIASDAPDYHSGEGGASPTPALKKQTTH
jgi:hypothetical protein